jgi:MoaA/NifB/PqqE/SkfB family radical SAM enzyme
MTFSSIKKLNKKLSFLEYEYPKPILSSKPRIIFIELTENCNLKCSMCRSEKLYDPSLTMPLEMFKRICDSLLPYAEYVDLRGWGESTIIPDFTKYVEYASKFECHLKLITNLNLEDDEIWYKLVEYGTNISISIDSPIKETYERIRSGSRFETVQSNIKKIVNHSIKIHGSAESINFTTVVQGCNLKEIPKLIEFAAAEGIERIKLFPIIGPIQNPNNLFHHPEQLKEMLFSSYAVATDKHISVEVCATLHPNATLINRFPKYCIHPWMYSYISFNGRVGLCDHLMANNMYTVPYDIKSDFQDVWNGELFKKARQEHFKNSLTKYPISNFKPCNWCYYNRYIDIEEKLYSTLIEKKVYLGDIVNAFNGKEKLYVSPITEFDNH